MKLAVSKARAHLELLTFDGIVTPTRNPKRFVLSTIMPHVIDAVLCAERTIAKTPSLAGGYFHAAKAFLARFH